MLSELRKSIGSILYERSSSPFYGTLMISWLLWNWKIPYVTFFVDEGLLDVNKLEWVVLNSVSFWQLIIFPLISTAVIITVVPFLSNGAYWLNLNFRQWRIDKRNSIERNVLLTIDQSISLREQLAASGEKVEILLNEKNSEIKRLSLQVTHLEDLIQEHKDSSQKKVDFPYELLGPQESVNVKSIASKIIDNKELSDTFTTAVRYIQAGSHGLVSSDDVDSGALAYLEANEVLVSGGDGMFKFTEIGRKVMREYFDMVLP